MVNSDYFRLLMSYDVLYYQVMKTTLEKGPSYQKESEVGVCSVCSTFVTYITHVNQCC